MGTLSGVVGVVIRQLIHCAVIGEKLCWLSHPSTAMSVRDVRKAPGPCCRVSFVGSSLTVVVQHRGFEVRRQNQERLFLSIDVTQTPQP